MMPILNRLKDMPIWQLVIGFVLLFLVLVFTITSIRSCGTEQATVVETMDSGVTSTPLPGAQPDSQSSSPTVTLTPSPTATSTTTPTPKPTNTPRPTFTPSPTPIIVLTGVNQLGRLESTRYMMRDIVEVSDAPETFIERFSQDKLMLIAEGEVVAGFDLSKVSDRDIYAVRDTVLIMLPPAEILYTRIDNDRTFVYERETGIFRRADPDLETEARRIAEHHLESWALERGILAEAEADGIRFLESFLRSLGFTKIRIEVRASP